MFRKSTLSDNNHAFKCDFRWDFNCICFMNAENGNHTFQYSNPIEQFIRIDDWPQRDSIHQMKFTVHELSLNRTFCKGISNTLSSKNQLIKIFLLNPFH